MATIIEVHDYIIDQMKVLKFDNHVMMKDGFWLVCFFNQFILGFLKCKYLYVCHKKGINTKDYF